MTEPCPSSPLLPAPQAQTVPSAFIAYVEFWDVVANRNECAPTTETGEERGVTELSPHLPEAFAPQHHAEPLLFKATAAVSTETRLNACDPATETGLDLVVLLLSPHVPFGPHPHAQQEPSCLSAAPL